MSTLILMASFNGERYIADQIASITAQSVDDWRLLIRDDVSTDSTPALLEQAAANDARIEIVDNQGQRLGSAANFARLMETALQHDTHTIALCDQDDRWFAQKLASQQQRLAELEQMHGADCPILVHSDLAVVDQQMRPIHPSFMGLQHIHHPANTAPLCLLAQNHVVGCTILMNRALLDLATPVPSGVYMHDWWLALCAEFGGIRAFMPEPMADYRQHANNQVGVQGLAGRLARPWRWLAWLKKMNHIYRVAYKQAHYVATRLQQRAADFPSPPGTEPRQQQLQRFLELNRQPRPLRPLHLRRIGMVSQNWPMTALYYLQSLTLTLRH